MSKNAHYPCIILANRSSNLVGMYGKKPIKCVGISFGVDRIFTILRQRQTYSSSSEIDVFVMAFGDKSFTGLLIERMEITAQLWDAGIKVDTASKVKPKLPQQFKAAEAAGASIAVILGHDELAVGKVRVKVLGLSSDDLEKEGTLVDKAMLVEEVRKRLQQIRQ
jgi:histidyl-tRNA synthetase